MFYTANTGQIEYWWIQNEYTENIQVPLKSLHLLVIHLITKKPTPYSLLKHLLLFAFFAFIDQKIYFYSSLLT